MSLLEKGGKFLPNGKGVKGKAILLSSDNYAALHLIMTRFWAELSRNGIASIKWFLEIMTQ